MVITMTFGFIVSAAVALKEAVARKTGAISAERGKHRLDFMLF
jgi:hypothetical protein